MTPEVGCPSLLPPPCVVPHAHVLCLGSFSLEDIQDDTGSWLPHFFVQPSKPPHQLCPLCPPFRCLLLCLAAICPRTVQTVTLRFDCIAVFYSIA